MGRSPEMPFTFGFSRTTTNEPVFQYPTEKNMKICKWCKKEVQVGKVHKPTEPCADCIEEDYKIDRTPVDEEWMFDGPKLQASTDKEWREYYERKDRESFKEETRLKDEIQKLVAVAHKHGWNGVENSKILWNFFDQELEDKKKLQESLDQVDDVLIINWVGPRKDGDYRRALADLVDFQIKIENDPQVSKEAQWKLDELCDLHLEIETLKNKLERAERRALGF